MRQGSGSPRWTDGAEAAFTIVPNFLATGLLAIAVGIALLFWSRRRRAGRTVRGYAGLALA